MRLVAITCFITLWFLNSILLARFYDVSIYEEFIMFWNTRGILYDGMFLSLSVILFTSWKGIEKALACFMTIITAGSFVDKAFFKIADYVYSDFVLVFLGITVSAILYGKTKSGISDSGS